MVYIMVCSIVTSQVLQWIPGERVTAVIIDGLDGRTGEKPHSLSGCQTRKLERYASSHGVEKEALEWVII
jgi:hypothetical protein